MDRNLGGHGIVCVQFLDCDDVVARSGLPGSAIGLEDHIFRIGAKDYSVRQPLVGGGPAVSVARIPAI